MGMDVRFGIIYGVRVWDTILEDKPYIERKERTLYNRYTGKPDDIQSYSETKYKLLINIDGFGKVGDLVDDDDFRKWIINHRNIINNEDDDGLFIYDYNGVKFFGIKAFVGHEPYEYPQDMCIEFNDNTVVAKELWEQFFPNIPGKLLLYMRVSV
jgi:hypothetical protein